MTQITGRVAIVTGGGRGLGRAMVLGLAQAGAYVVATAARERAELETVAREVQQSCGEARVLPRLADVTEEDDCSQIVEAAIRHFGRLDILVNNAARGMKYVSKAFLTEPTRFWEVAPQTWRMMIDTNVNGPLHDGQERGAGNARGGLGTDCQRLDEPRDYASPRFLALWSVEGGARIGNDHLVAGSCRHGSDRECASARRSYPHRHDSERCAGRSTVSVARPCNRCTTVALAGFAGFRRDDWPPAGGDKMAN